MVSIGLEVENPFELWDIVNTSKTAHVIKDLCTAENIRQKDQLIGVVDTSVQWPADSQKYDLYINEEGMHELVLKSSMSNATDFAKVLSELIFMIINISPKKERHCPAY